MQAEHIPVHLGAMPSAVAAVLDEEHEPGRRLDPQRPLPRRHPPARHHGDLAALPWRRAGRLRGQPRPPRRRGRPRAGQHARRLAHARGGGRGDPARLARCEPTASCCDELAARMRGPRQREADLRAQLAANRAGAERGRRRWSSATGSTPAATAMEETLDYAERRTRARIAELEDGEREATDVLEARRRRPRAARCSATVDGDELTLDFTGSRRPARRQPQLPAGRDALRLLLRPARAGRSRRARPARAPTARSTVIAPEGSLLNARAAGRGGGRATSRPPRAWPTSCWPRSAARSARAR